MILTHQNIGTIDIDLLINEMIKAGDLNKLLFIVPTKRKIRYLTRELISLSPDKSASGLKIETLGSLSEKMLTEIDGNILQISEEASILLMSHSFKKTKLKYFSQYRDQIPFGTLERVRNVIEEYKRHDITPERLIEEADNLKGGEKLKALDIAEVFIDYQKSLKKNNFLETGDIYSSLISKEKKTFDETFEFLYLDTQYIFINGFDEFTSPEVEIISSVSKIQSSELFIILDYYKYNPAIFSHLNSCHDRLVQKGFKEVKDTSQASHNKFVNAVRENFSLSSVTKKEKQFQDTIKFINALSREEEVELIAKEIKKLFQNKKVEPEKICLVFNLIGNYSPLIRDKFNVFGIPFNLTDRFSLSTSPPVKAIISLLEVAENDYYFKNIFRAFSGGFLGPMGIEISDLLKTSVELKIVSGKENWVNKITTAITEISSEEQGNQSIEKLESYRQALSDLKKINGQLKPFAGKLTPDDFRKNLLKLIFKLDLPKILLQAPPDVVENDSFAFNSFINVLDEVTNLLELEHGINEKFSLHFYLNQLRTTTSFARYNIPEKPGFGVQVTTLNEIRGLNFDYLFIGGLNDGDLPTRFTPEIFFSGSFAKEEVRHQVEQRYLFYQSLCTWKKKLYMSFPQADDKKDLVQSSFLKDFKSLFELKETSKAEFADTIYSKEELLEYLGRISSDQRDKIKIPEEVDIDLKSINNSIKIDKNRIEDPFGESEFSGYISKNISEELKNKLNSISDSEFSATQLEVYAKCPFKYFVENILRLETIAEPVEELEAFEYGSLIHTILYEFYTKLKEQGIVLFDCSEEEFKTASNLLFQIAEKKFDELKLNPDLSFYEREKLLGINGRRNQSLLYKFLEEERKNDSGYAPEFLELSFGNVRHREKNDKKRREAINAGGVNLKGKIDRIDINKNENTFKVIDYKLGGMKPTKDDLLNGISLQLPLYLFASKELIKNELEQEYKPADAQIFSLKFNEKDFGRKSVGIKGRSSKSDNIEEKIEGAEEMIKICLEMVKKFTEDISKGIFHLSTLNDREAKVCRFCDFRRICRIQEVD